ncbi:MAG: hypothetical protein QM796_10610 [Chthoniobacteraceae bacterium]
MKKLLESSAAGFLDALMSVSMNAVQWRHRLHGGSRAALEKYVADCGPLSREQFYAAPTPELLPTSSENQLHWVSPITSGLVENDRVHVELFPCARGWSAPTVFMLHALMSASDAGYRRWAQCFNELWLERRVYSPALPLHPHAAGNAQRGAGGDLRSHPHGAGVAPGGGGRRSS